MDDGLIDALCQLLATLGVSGGNNACSVCLSQIDSICRASRELADVRLKEQFNAWERLANGMWPSVASPAPDLVTLHGWYPS